MGKSTFFTAAAVLAAGASAQLFPRNATTPAIGTGATGSSSSSTIIGTGITTSSSSIFTSIASSNSTSSTATSVAGGVGSNSTIAIPTSTQSSNGTSVSTAAPSPTASDPVFCPALSGQIYAGPLNVNYSIACDINHGGVLINISINKRQAASNGTSLQDCLNFCSTLDQCVATAYDTNNPQCFFYSSLGNAFQANGFEFATVAARGAINGTSTSATASAGTSLPAVSASGAPYPSSNVTTSRGSTASQSQTSGVSVSGVSTSGTSTGGVSTPTSAPNDFFCPGLNGQVYITGLGLEFIIECGRAHFGVIIDIVFSKKRQAIGGADDLGDCLDVCSNTAGCVGTAFNTVAGTCTLYSSVGAAYNDANSQFAIKVAANAVATPGQTITVPVFGTSVVNAAGTTVTQTLVVSSTAYVCPTYTTYAALPIACTSCPYAAVTATAYSTTTVVIKSCAPTVTNCPYNSNGVYTAGATGANGGNAVVTVTTCPVGYTLTTGGTTTVLTAASVITTTVNAGASTGAGKASSGAAGTTGGSESGVTDITKTTVTPVATTVVNYPLPTSTGQQATGSVSIVSTISGKTSATGTKSGAAATSTGLQVYTGAATQLTAGGVAGAVIAGLALML